MSSFYLLKTEASAYSFADLQRDKVTVWDGVHNPVALRNLGAMKPGDKLIVYHTGDQKSADGTASVDYGMTTIQPAADPLGQGTVIFSDLTLNFHVGPGTALCANASSPGSVLGSATSLSRLVTARSVMPQGLMSAKPSGPVVTLKAKPCDVTPRET